MVKQKIVLKLLLDDERKRRKAFKAAVGVSGVTSASMEGDKLIVAGDGVDAIALTTMLRRSLGYAELLSVSSGDDKKKDGYGGYGGGMSFGGGKEGKESSKDGSKGGGHQYVAAPMMPYAAYQQYSAAPPSYPVYPSYPAYQHQEQDPGCSIM